MSTAARLLRAAAGATPPTGVLGGVAFGEAAAGSAVLTVRAPVFAPAGDSALLFAVDEPVFGGHLGRVRHATAGELMFGCIEIDEGGSLQAATATAYGELFACLEAMGAPPLLRLWNYLPRINEESDGVERYRRFNAGRQQAFEAAGRPLAGDVPAACALGVADGPLSIAFLAAGEGCTPVENPRQVSAYHYPPEYGERSPTFSRAALARLGGEDVLFVSGTAAIVGHRSLHAGDVVAQTRETLANLAAVVEAANAQLDRPRFALDALDYTVYVRHAADVHAVRRELAAALGGASLRLVEADICRAELLVEIEAIGGLPMEGP